MFLKCKKLMSFDKCIHPCNQNPNQDMEYFYNPRRNFSYHSFPVNPLLQPLSLGHDCLIVLSVFEINLNGIIQYILFWNLVSFTQPCVYKIHLFIEENILSSLCIFGQS